MASTSGETASRLRSCREEILRIWEQQVRAEVPPAQRSEKPALRNSLPRLLDGLITTLADPDLKSAHATEEAQRAAEHGRLRALDVSYSLDQVIHEYHVLQRVLFDTLERDGHALSAAERDVICGVLFMSIRNASSVFKDVRDDDREQESGRQSRLCEEALSEKSREAALNAQLLQTIFERVEDYAIFSLDPDGHITSWALGAEKMKQYTRDEVIGKHFEMLYPEEGRIRDEPRDHLANAAKVGRFRGEGLRRRKDGTTFLADVFISPMYESDRLVGFFKIVTDLTERNRVIQERDLTRARAETLQLEADLRERFVFTLTHDLKNPLSAARACAELIIKQPCNVDRHRDLSHRSVLLVERVDHMVTDLLDASRVKSGQLIQLHLAQFDAAEQLRHIGDDYGTIHGGRFLVHAPPSAMVFWDPHAVRRAIENLVTNAIKYGDANATVTMTMVCAGDRVLMSVHNHGSAIAITDQELLFELFHRTEAAKAGPKRGWGIGLTLVRGITEAHGGIVTVRSVPEEGTTFTLDLPRDARGAVRPASAG